MGNTISNYNFKNINFKTLIDGMIYQNCSFTSCEFSGTVSNTTFTYCQFTDSIRNATFINCDFQQSPFSQKITLQNVRFQNCIFQTPIDLSGSTLQNVHIDSSNNSSLIATSSTLIDVSFSNILTLTVDFTNSTIQNLNITCETLNASCANATLSYSTLSNIQNISNTNFTNATLSYSTLSNIQNISNTNFTNATLNNSFFQTVQLTSSDFTNASLQNIDIYNTSFNQIVFTNTILFDVIIHSSIFQNCTFDNILKDTTFTTCTFEPTVSFLTSILRTTFVNCTFKTNNFVPYTDIQSVSFQNCSLQGYPTVLTQSNLSNVLFIGTDLSNVNFTDSTIQNLSLSNISTMKNVNFTDASMTNIILQDISTCHIDLSHATVDNLVIRNIHDMNAKFMSSDLSNVTIESITSASSVIDFTNSTIQKMNIRQIVPNINMKFISANLTDTTLESLKSCTVDFTNVSAQRIQLLNIDMVMGTLNSAEMENILFRTVRFTSNFNNAKLNKGLLSNIQFDTCSMAYTQLNELDFQQVIFTNCTQTQNLDFSSSKLTNINLSRMNLSQSKFIGSTLNEINFTSSNLSQSDFTNADFQKSSIEKVDFSNAIFKNLYSRFLYGATTLVPSSGRLILNPAVISSSSTSTYYHKLIDVFKNTIRYTTSYPITNRYLIKRNFVYIDGTRQNYTHYRETTTVETETRELNRTPENNFFIGPMMNLTNVTLENMNLDGMDLRGVNFYGATLRNLSVDQTMFFQSVFERVVSSGITGTPKSLPIGTTIFNSQFFYTQDNIYLPKITVATPKITSNSIIPTIISDPSENVLFAGVLQNTEQHLVIYLSQKYVDLDSFEENHVSVRSGVNHAMITSFSIPDFYIASLTAQQMKYGKGGMLIGYGYHHSILNPLKYVIIRLDSNGYLDSLYHDIGYQIKDINHTHYPSGYTEMSFNSKSIHYVSQSYNREMAISKMNFEYLLDCSGRDFSGKNLSGTDLSGINFTNCDLSGTNLSYCNLTNSNFTNANMYRTNLSYSILSNVNLTDVQFNNPNLTGVFLSTQDPNVVLPGGYKFINGYLVGPGLNLDGMDLSGFNLSNINFRGSTLRNTILTNTTIWGTNFIGCVFGNTITGGMRGTPILPNGYKLMNGSIVGPFMNLRNAPLGNQDLTGMNLVNTNVHGADLSGCIFKDVTSGSMIGTPILSPDTKLINGYLIGRGVIASFSDLSGGDLSGVDISGAILTRANFYNVRSGNVKGIANLSPDYEVRNGYIIGPDVNLSGMDLSGVDLSNMDVIHANVSDADLRYANINGISTGELRGTPLLDSKYKLYNGYIVGPNVRLIGADLTDIDVYGMELENTDLQDAILTNVRSGNIKGIPKLSSNYKILKGYIVGKEVDLSGQNLEGQDFSNLDLKETNFTNAKLNHAIFHKCSIIDTDFTNIEYEDIRSSDLEGIPASLPNKLVIKTGYINGNLSRVFVGPTINLKDIEFRNENFDNVDLSHSKLSNVYFNQTTIQQTNFNQTNLFAIRSQNVSGIPINLSSQWKIVNGYMIGPDANLMSADFTNMDLSGLNLSNVNLLGVRFRNTKPGPFIGQPILDFDSKLFDIQIQNLSYSFILGPGMNLSGINLSGLNLSNLNLSNTILQDTDLRNTNLRNVSSGGIIGMTSLLPPNWKIINGYLIGPMSNLSSANLEKLNLSDVNLEYANLFRSNLIGTSLVGATLNGVKSGEIRGIPILPSGWKIINGYLIGPQVNLTDSDLSGIDLSNMDLSGTNFTNTNLTNVNFSNTILTNAKFLGANLTNIFPDSIYDQIDLTGVTLPFDNYLQYNYFVSKDIKMSDFLSMKYNDLKRKVFQKVFNEQQDIRKDISLSFIKRFYLKLYNDLYIVYKESSNGTKDEKYFETLTLFDVDTRSQIYQRTLTLIGNIEFVDEFLLRLMNRFDIETIPENILRNINFSLVLPETATLFYMKHLFNERFHTMILAQQSTILSKVETFLRKTSKIYDDNLFVNRLYGVSNHSIHEKYLDIVKKYRFPMEIVENYMYAQDIVDKYTNAPKIATLFRKMVDLDKKYVTPVVFDLFKKIITNIFGPLSQRDDFELYKLNENRLFISYDFEKHLVTEFINKNQSLVESMFVIRPKLQFLWNELRLEKPDIKIIVKTFGQLKTLNDAITFFRIKLFENVKLMTYTYVYPSDITQTVLEVRENKLDSLMNMNDENIDVISEYLKDNSHIQTILQNPQQYIQDIQSPNFESVKDITQLYNLSIYSNPEMKEKMIRYDIHSKLDQDELRYLQLFSGIHSDIKGDENLIAPLEEYRRIWNIIMS
jgi:uncharacterized protein YjbI with pentapeptide repeats